jgi:hypothetical protein
MKSTVHKPVPHHYDQTWHISTAVIAGSSSQLNTAATNRSDSAQQSEKHSCLHTDAMLLIGHCCITKIAESCCFQKHAIKTMWV